MADYGTILVDVDGPVATVTLNRPDQMNAWNWRMHAELRHAFHHLDRDDEIRAIVVTGAGKAFCAGADLGGGGETFTGEGQSTVGDRRQWLEKYDVPQREMCELATPIIAAINGAAVGAGLTMATAMDIRIAADDAKLGYVFNRRGVMPDADILWTVPRLIGFSRALDLLLTGRIFLGREAAEMGLVARAVPRAEVLPTALQAARDIATNTAPVSAAITKKLAYRFMDEPDHRAAAALQLKLFAWTGRQPDAAEGVMAFLERRDPRWKLAKNRDLPEDLA
jgi:enoyl-CoA hydratase/carnithine racemase